MVSESIQPPVRLGTRVAYRNPWLSVREDTLVLADGSTGIYGVVEKADYALIIPEENGGFHLVEQFRHAVGRRPPDRELTEADMVHAFVTEDEFRRMIADGEIFDAPTIAAYGLLRMVG
jgi:hypothetical protein